ncbi:MAG: sugar phosphate nucleotidyltransferase, partial [Terriglobia bacterium]
GKIGTVAGVLPASRYGELSLSGNLVAEFSEKPAEDERFVSGGFFVFQRRMLEYLTPDDNCILEKEPLEKLAREGQLIGYLHRSFWHSMDTYRDFTQLNELWKKGAPWRIWD